MVHKKPSPDRLRQMAKHEALKDMDGERLTKIVREYVQISARFNKLCTSLLLYLKEF